MHDLIALTGTIFYLILIIGGIAYISMLLLGDI